MDRTIQPGIPGGEDAGAVVGVVGLHNKGRSSTMDSSKGKAAGSKRKVGTRVKPVLAVSKTVAKAEDPEVARGAVPGDRAGRSSVAPEP